MVRIFNPLIVTNHNSPAGAAFGMPTTRGAVAARDYTMFVLAARGAG
ncbi:MAG TPA: hypothetical protein VG365_02735 [Solirubrobacteraceae bacterium]|jgi:hypothetical protein|nr:hypothetical protein [Solirubrobacteraceae bacterium]